MKRFPGVLILALLFLAAGPRLSGEEPKGADPVARRLEEQTAQIRLLTREIARLADAVEALQRTEGPVPRAEPVVQTAEPSGPSPAPPSNAETAPEQTTTGPTHVVVKGETLTSIARQHGISLDELIRLNQIVDGRKLQIGQTLRLPTPPPLENP